MLSSLGAQGVSSRCLRQSISLSTSSSSKLSRLSSPQARLRIMSSFSSLQLGISPQWTLRPTSFSYRAWKRMSVRSARKDVEKKRKRKKKTHAFKAARWCCSLLDSSSAAHGRPRLEALGNVRMEAIAISDWPAVWLVPDPFAAAEEAAVRNFRLLLLVQLHGHGDGPLSCCFDSFDRPPVFLVARGGAGFATGDAHCGGSGDDGDGGSGEGRGGIKCRVREGV